MQEEILSLLEECKKPMSRTEIANALSKDVVLISHNISRLVKAMDIKVIEINRKQALEKYKCKRRMRLYYC